MRFFFFCFCLLSIGCSQPHVVTSSNESAQNFKFPNEKYFLTLRRLSLEGTNKAAHWSFDGQWLSFQHKGPGLLNVNPICDQIYKIRKDGSEVQRLSDGLGQTSGSFFFPNGKRVLFSSTEATQPVCPSEPDMSKRNLWPIYNSYQIYGVLPDGTDAIPLEPGASRAYHAEASLCRDKSVLFTSDRTGDPELYRATLDTFGTLNDIKQITRTLGYNGGAFFSPDCKKIVWHASRPRTKPEIAKYRRLLTQHWVDPTHLEIWTADADGSHAQQITRLGAMSFAPTFTPDSKRIIFSSNLRNPQGHDFDLYLIQTNGTGLTQVTFSGKSDGFPMFSPDGKNLVFSSNRNSKSPQDQDIFIAEWIEPAIPNSGKDANSTDRYLNLVRELSSPEMEGRGVGTAGLERSENWVVDHFSTIGLRPLDPTFKMSVPIQLTKEKTVTANNIISVWGTGCSKMAPIVVGAHLDHLGFGSKESLEPSQSGLHPGADDNASGIAALLESARMIVENPKAKQACFIFAAFTGEEVGIAGSSRFVDWLKKRHIHPKAMLNMDMVGRMENNTLIAFGSDSALEWKKLLSIECDSRGFTCTGGGDGYGPSDHMAFYIDKVPVLHFFTGAHLDYHRTTDTFDKINATGGIQVAEIVAAIALKASSKSVKFHFQKASAIPMMGRLQGKGKSSHGAYLGTIPDYSTLTSPHGPSEGSAAGGGVKLAGTRPGSPADQAGVKAGDILKSIQNQKIVTLQDFTDILSELHPGDKISVELERDGILIKTIATLGKRN